MEKKLLDKDRFPLVVEMAYSTLIMENHHGRPYPATSCFFFVSLMHLAEGSKRPSVVLRSLPSTAKATDSNMSTNCWADHSRDSVVVLAVVLPNLKSKLLHVSCCRDSRKRRICLEFLQKKSVIEQFFFICW